MIIVNPIDRLYGLKIMAGEETILFTFKQLEYKTKSEINSQTIQLIQGQVTIDTTMQCFLNIKYGLKDVDGLHGPDKKPYKLKFETNEKKCLTDACVDELLATPLNNQLIFSAREMLDGIPTEIINPSTNKPVEGVEIVSPEKFGELPKN